MTPAQGGRGTIDTLHRDNGRRYISHSYHQNLSYDEMCLGRDGTVMTADDIRNLRDKEGFCLECRGQPVKLYEIKKSRFNPLYKSKIPLKVDGECFDGKCLICHPRLDPRGPRSTFKKKKKKRPEMSGQRSSRQSMAQVESFNDGDDEDGSEEHSQDCAPSRLDDIDAMTMSIEQMFDGKRVESISRPTRNASLNPQQVQQRQRESDQDRPSQNQHSSSNYNHGRIGSGSGSGSGSGGGSGSHGHGTVLSATMLDPLGEFRPGLNRANPTEESQRSMGSHRSSGSQRSSGSSPSQRSSGSRRSGSMGSEIASTVEDRNLERYFSGLSSEGNAASSEPAQSNSAPVSPSGNRSVRWSLNENSPHVLSEEESSQSTNIATNLHDHDEPHHEQVQDPKKLVNDLESLVKTLVDENQGGFAIDVLVEAMQNNPDVVEVQIYTISKIWELCKNHKENKNAVISSTAPDDILLAMKNHMNSADLQGKSCGALWSLSVDENHRKVLIKAGTVLRLIQALLKYEKDENVARTALGALRTLSTESEVKQQLQPLEGKSLVIKAMSAHQHVASMQRDGIAFLSNSAVDVENRIVSVAGENEIKAILQAMSDHKDIIGVMAPACFALKNYAFDENNVRALCKMGGNVFAILEHVVNSTLDPSCRNDAEIVLDTLQKYTIEEGLMVDAEPSTDDYPTATAAPAARILDENSIPSLVSGLHDNGGSVDSIQENFKALLTLSQQSSLLRNKIIASGAVGSILSNLILHKASCLCQSNGAELLHCLCDENDYARRTLIEAGGCVAIVASIEQHKGHPPCLRNLFRVLNILSKEFECWFELEQNGKIAIIQDTLVTQSDSILQEEGNAIVTNFLMHGT